MTARRLGLPVAGALLVLASACSDSSRSLGPARPTNEPAVGHAVLSRLAKNPMALAVTPASDVYYIERTGEVRHYAARTGRVTDALVLEVDTAHENGLLGLAVDPSFGENGFVYLYYSLPLEDPLPVDAPPGQNVLAHFTAREDGSLDPESRVELLSVPSDRLCCHEGGGLAFGPDRTIFLAVGDNTNPFASSGYAPLDGRPGRASYDARRTAANPFDLRGKILRVTDEGGIPPGNLYPESGELGRPELYTQGSRNPFRIAVDPADGALYWGEIGPDASVDGALGPRGYDEINRAVAPGDFGWPFCIGPALPYTDYDFETGTRGAAFDCAESVPSLAAYDYDTEYYPALGTGFTPDGLFLGRAIMAGAVNRPSLAAPYALPAALTGSLLVMDWARDVVAAVTLGADGSLAGVERLYASESFHRPIDLEVGPDGAVYVLDFGSGFWGDNADAALHRLEFGTGLSPIASISASATFGSAPLTLELSAKDSHASGADETLVRFEWDFDADGSPDASGEDVTHVFEEPGNFSVGLVVTSSSGKKSAPVSENVVVGNSPPSVRIISPDPLAVIGSGTVTLVGEGMDPEDGAAACEELVWNVSLGHAGHAHPLTSLSGCTASFTPDLGDHATTPSSEPLFYALELVYTDHGGAEGEAPLTARQGIRLDAAR